MKRKIMQTADGSHTFYNPEIDEPYHSMNGAIQESLHIFIKQGLGACVKNKIRILEIGFGTGLNMLLTLKHARSQKKSVYYHAVEKFPLDKEEYNSLNYCQFLGPSLNQTFLMAHDAQWNIETRLDTNFVLFKELADFREMDPGYGFDIVYFDAFAPSKQPELWDISLLKTIYELISPQGIWVSYTAKGSVKRALQSSGFTVEKLPGPPGKREILRGRKA